MDVLSREHFEELLNGDVPQETDEADGDVGRTGFDSTFIPTDSSQSKDTNTNTQNYVQ